MNNTRVRRLLPITLVLGVLAIAPALAAKGGKGQVINWQMTPTVDDLDARGKVQYKAMVGRERFHLIVRDLDLGTYSFDVNGTSMASFDMVPDDDGAGTAGKLRLSVRKGSLNFDPRGADLAVSQGGTVFLATSFPGSVLEARETVEIEVDLVALTDALPDAEGEAEFRSRGGRNSFEVEIGGIPAGTFDVLVGGVLRNSIIVGVEGRGEVEFDTLIDDDGEDGIPEGDFLLDFDPRGQLVQVSGNGTLILGAMFPTEPVAEDDDEDDGEADAE